METQITKPTKAINWQQLAEEAEVTLGGIRTKGDKMFFIDMTQSDVDKLEAKIATHIPTDKEPTGFNSTQLSQIRQIIQEELSI